MIGQSIAEEMDYTSFFDQIDDLIDFPIEDIGSGFAANDSYSFPNVWMTQPESFPSSDAVFAAKNSSNSSTELYVPFEEIVQMEWLSSSVDNSFSGGTQTQNLTINKKEDSSTNTDSSSSSSSNPNQFQSSSPVSILDSTSSNTAKPSGPAKRGPPRTKRPRPTPPSSSSDEIDEVEEKDKTFLCSRAESRLVIRFPKQIISEHKKKKKTKKMVLSPVLDDPEENRNRECITSSQQPVRKCMHCEITKTPQWRLGPMGPKTLCNACGVRYKTGRLFPEYRPAASPTFVPSIHSNSHKKVVEMRIKNRDTGFMGDTEPVSSDLPDLVPNCSNVVMD